MIPANLFDSISDHLNGNTFLKVRGNGKTIFIQHDNATDYEEDVCPVIVAEVGTTFRVEKVSGLLFFADYTFKNGVQVAEIV